MFRTIVVGYDETEPAQRALARAADLATAFACEVVVASVAPVLAGSREMGGVDPIEPPDLHLEELDHARRFLRSRGVEGQFELAVGDAASAIVRLAHEHDADLIVVGTRQPGLVSTILGHSVSGTVRRKARCDVLTVV